MTEKKMCIHLSVFSGCPYCSPKKEETFEENFPSLEHNWLKLDKSVNHFIKYYGLGLYNKLEMKEGLITLGVAKLIKHCLDKQRVKEAMDKHINYCCDCGCTFGKDKILKELGL